MKYTLNVTIEVEAKTKIEAVLSVNACLKQHPEFLYTVITNDGISIIITETKNET